VSAWLVHCMERHRRSYTVSVVCGIFPANAPRTPTSRAQPRFWNTMSQSPCPGEQCIEEVTDVDIMQTSPEECLEGEHLKFKARIRGWKTRTRKERCQNLLEKADHNLRQALLRPQWKDVLLIPQDWYPSTRGTPRYEKKGW